MIEKELAKKTVRKDKLKSQSEVIKAVAKDPLATQRKIAKEAGVGLGTANRVLQELEQNGTESNIMDTILQMDDEIIALTNGITLEMIQDKVKNGEKLTIQDNKILSDIANNSTKRKAIFGEANEGKADRDITIQI